MHLISELKKEINDAVLFDTNVFIDLENKTFSKVDLNAVETLISTDMKPFVTDLSFCEMLIGCRNLDDYYFHMNNINTMEFWFCGSNEPVCLFLSTFDYESVKTKEDFFELKNKVLSLRKNALFPLFQGIFNFYALMCFNLLQHLDRNYWDQLYILFNNFLNSFRNEYQQIVLEIYDKYIDSKKDSKRLIKDLFIGFATSLLIKTECQKYNGENMEVKLNDALTRQNFSKWFASKALSANKKDSLWLYKTFIIKAKKLIKNGDYSQILIDGILFIVSKLIFDNANFDSHDLIDLYNIDFFAGQDISFHYFTNDCKRKWLDFLKILRELHPDIKINFNF